MPIPFEPFVPRTITVHLGAPDQPAANVTVPFPQYIMNVASSEIYPTWNEEAILANLRAQVSFALNRVYTEYYRTRGYDFDITNSTAIDQSYVPGQTIFENIDRLVSREFNTYIVRQGNIEPLAARYCNGTTSTCSGMSQWGSQELAEQGYDAMEILRYYYGPDITLVVDAPMADVTESYPGSPLRPGSSGRSVRILQQALNRIAKNFPAIPRIPEDGIYGPETEAAVRIFQQVFGLEPDGITGKATWYKVIFLYSGVTRLAELNSEGNLLFQLPLDYAGVLQEGDEGIGVQAVQYLLALAAAFFETVPKPAVDGIFGPATRAAVLAFQRQFFLTQTGRVDVLTWEKLLQVYRGIRDAGLLSDFSQ
ncbi:MAG: peptidoglycan-binding protein [Firmicutes bacterium]|nr:peptidoglycan-binding protein [Bacillota bacterium]